MLNNSQNSDSSLSQASPEATTSSQFSQEQLNRIETNRKRALDIRQNKEKTSKLAKLMQTNYESQKKIDTGAGFYLDEQDLIEEEKKESKLIETPPVPSQDKHLNCLKCFKKFPHSFLSLNYDLNVCDSCKVENSQDYELISKTDAKEEFLLKDCDFDFREPVLKFITRKNPHKKYGEMKLYLRCQCAQRAMEVHENEEKLVEKKELKILNLHKTRQKNYEKKLQELRKEARQGQKKTTEYHKHDFGEEVYNQEKDNYYKICKTCDYKMEYEEL